MNGILGVNHQFLYPRSITDEKIHTQTLKELSESDKIDAIDCWVWRGDRADEEIKILLDSGKKINYNIGDRFGEEISLPTSKSKADVDRAYDLIMREISYAIKVNSKKIVFASGPDTPNEHEDAIKRFEEYVMRITKELPDDVVLALEPTDWDIDKRFLLGKLDESVDFIHKIRENGFERIGLLLDMCHIPIMHETLESALEKADDTLVHIHLGNCMIKNKSSEFYGDKHIPWDYPDGEFTSADGANFIKDLKKIGYFDDENATISFEMRPVSGLDADSCLKLWRSVWKDAMK